MKLAICSQCSQEKTAVPKVFWEQFSSMMTMGCVGFSGLFPVFPRKKVNTRKKVRSVADPVGAVLCHLGMDR